MANISTENPAPDDGGKRTNQRTPDGDETAAGPGADGGGAKGLPTRRDRLQALRAKRQNLTGTNQKTADFLAGAQAPTGRRAAMLGAAGLAQGKQRRQMIMKIYALLTQTPEEGTGMVPDTPFSETGVSKLMEILRGRAAQEDQPGAKIAAGMLKFLTPQDPEAEAIGGASVEKLQMVARAAQKFRERGAG